jgi:uncharacterized membrane protein YcaP (DUF421 family)
LSSLSTRAAGLLSNSILHMGFGLYSEQSSSKGASMIGTFFSTLLTATLAYAVVVGLLRATGKRTLARMNTFDLIVVVALGSILARTILSGGTSLFQGIFALTILAGLQFALEWLSARDPRLRKVLTAEPSLLFHRGSFLHRVMKANRMAEADVMTAVRQSGIGDMADVEAVVLESNGDISVIRRGDRGSASTLDDVERSV